MTRVRWVRGWCVGDEIRGMEKEKEKEKGA